MTENGAMECEAHAASGWARELHRQVTAQPKPLPPAVLMPGPWVEDRYKARQDETVRRLLIAVLQKEGKVAVE